MANPAISSGSKQQRTEHALRLARMGDLDGAADAFREAIAHDSRNLDLLFNLAIVEEQRGEIDEAALLLTSVLDRKPTFPSAAARLSRLLARFRIEDLAVLIPSGLRAAMKASGVAHQPVVDATFDWLCEFDPMLGDGIALITQGGADERGVARPFIVQQTADGLTAGLLLLCLRAGIVKRPGLERLLTGLRAAILLDCPPIRFADRGFFDVALALVAQGWHNDHTWAETADESGALAKLVIDRAALLAGDQEATRRFVCAALYRPLAEVVTPPLTAIEARRLKPRSLREAIEPQLAEAERQRVMAQAIPALRPLADTTSLKVAGQYETAPYPRWTSLQVSPEGAMKRGLAQYFPDDRLTFMDRPFDVLIAGCGTGQQALQAASAYGANARMLAIDLSRASLGYASDMAARNNLPSVSFLQADLLDAAALDRDFDVIECVGVLHHMADWRAGWRILLQRLKPTGLMYIGLYSAVARRELTRLRDEPGYPGPGCSADAARKYRRELLLRDDAAAGGNLKISRDFYALHAFRDLMLHESEAHVTIGEIASFLEQNKLAFAGFTVEPSVQQDFAAAFPGEARPGALGDWARFERDNPRTFDAMYRFWIERRT